ncbi:MULTISPECIES: SgcJ/EcaC family oxidoreductase [unclassified Pseudomonas]|uniref:SgcJ/EcaC family oxidoreductase n=1 Tax=unclassified Pseudomonas TaxID=196821 RepID=UPI000BD1BEDF|nr:MULTISPECIES: SgcJ/EcaC family oxidoreductase [unclassified Pseudomonas]PVZ11226.1 uncharacterized protein (TIGR02246 family) [Pseudomonas sp. URIL14HWK12:I12]PVZ22224.1 uncharacterized protein (TIGR02246 family) [Pseudomonas sp. URIL14HWK12:I10]PVZ31652.1 uncharacterized protein (TIGR02246 family) [Pseudomonas sp. URIL14HWK12:I11]SNZ16711.1 conserved hypothetical protein [Pseudomonas sp. URIL14HWK12:I9]
MKRSSIAIGLALAGFSAMAHAQSTTCASLSDQQIHALFDTWNQTLATRDAGKMAGLYAPDAVLLPTLSNELRNDRASIADYFEHFLAKGPSGAIDERFVVSGCNKATDVGTYTFSFADGSQAKARYSYVYRYRDGQWLISHHHSSVMPEG